MRRNKLELFVHLVWATWDRQPLISPGIERRLHRNIEAVALEMGCTVLALDGMDEHVHIVLSIPATVSIADLAKQLKGVSSHFANETLQPGFLFRWQGSYGAFTISPSEVDRVVRYVRHQKQHHGSGDLIAPWEECAVEVDVPPPASP